MRSNEIFPPDSFDPDIGWSPASLVVQLSESKSFPSHPTTETGLDNHEVGLLASLTAWTVSNADSAFLAMYGYTQP